MLDRLTPRQFECLSLSATFHDQQIAERLGISVHTVRQHIDEAKSRLGVQDRKAARRLLPQNGGEAEGGIASLPPEPLPLQTAGGSQPSSADQGPDKRRPLYEVYASFGKWRVPPKIGGSRLPLIVLVALISIGVVASLAMLQSVMETLGRLR